MIILPSISDLLFHLFQKHCQKLSENIQWDLRSSLISASNYIESLAEAGFCMQTFQHYVLSEKKCTNDLHSQQKMFSCGIPKLVFEREFFPCRY